MSFVIGEQKRNLAAEGESSDMREFGNVVCDHPTSTELANWSAIR
jgi:hypothetical protein